MIIDHIICDYHTSRGYSGVPVLIMREKVVDNRHILTTRGAITHMYDKGADKVLAEAKKRGWVTVSMKKDFRTVFEKGIERK